MLSLYKIIEKSLLLRDSPLMTPSPNFNGSIKVSTLPDNSTKMIERWNQVDLDYFDPHLDKAHKKRKIVFIRKDVYYRNMVFLV